MEKWSLILVLPAILLPGLSPAQVNPNPDGIGMYVDVDATTSAVTAEIGEMIEVYLILTRPSVESGIAAWECGIEAPANAVVWGWALYPHPGRFVFLIDPPDFSAGYQDFLPAADTVVLMTFNVSVTDSEPAVFFIRSHWKNSGGWDLPAFATMTDNVHLHPLYPWPGGVTQPALTINDGTSAPAERSTWGTVKNTYR
jgi:hypothetical protein